MVFDTTRNRLDYHEEITSLRVFDVERNVLWNQWVIKGMNFES